MEKLNHKEEDNEIVTLILQEERFKVHKEKLIQKSKYFAALLSSRYRDHHQSEHMINYSISVVIFQSFIKWIHDEKLEHSIHGRILSNKDIDFLLNLLKLSILFTVDKLTDDIIERIEECYLLPNYVINIWLVAQELSLRILEDICFATCLDRFHDVSLESIYKLSRNNFLKLISNNNLRCTHSYLKYVVDNWNKVTMDTLPEILTYEKQPKMLSAIVSSENFRINNKIYLHCWDGKMFFELDTFWFPKDFPSGKTDNEIITGIQVTGRGCYLYFIGGEFTIGSGRYNTNIWRYSLITKKWLRYANMPTARRHMITVFVENKLLLMGGIGRFRLKLDSIDIYDIHTSKDLDCDEHFIYGIWSKGAVMPFTFTTIPEFFVYDKKLVVYNNFPILYLYCPKKHMWNMLNLSKIFVSLSANVSILPLCDLACYIDVIKPDEIIFKGLTLLNDEFRSKFETSDGMYTIIRSDLRETLDDITFYLGKLFVNTSKTIDVLLCSGNHILFRGMLEDKYYCYSSVIQDWKKFGSLCGTSKRFFTVINPIDLYTSK